MCYFLITWMKWGNNRPTPTNRRTGFRTTMRKQHKATGLRPVSCKVPLDPPRVKLSHEYSAVLDVDIVFNPKAPQAVFQHMVVTSQPQDML